MQAVDPDQAGIERVVGEAAQAQPLRHDLAREPGACDRVGPAVGELPLAQVAVEIAYAHLVGVGARARSGATDRHPVGPDLANGYAGHVEHAVGRDVGRRIVDLVEKLLGAGGGVDSPARAGALADGHGALVGHVGEGEAETGQIGHVLDAGIGEIAAGHLARALQQVARRRGLGETNVIVVAPAKCVDDGADEERGVGDPAGHHHRRPGRERSRHRIRAEIGVGGRHARQDALQRRAGLHQGEVRAGGDGVAHVVAQQHGAAPVGEPEIDRDFRSPAARRRRIRCAHVAEHAHALRLRRRQHGAHALLELGVVAAPLPPPQRKGLARNGALGQALEGDVVEAAAFDQLDRRLPAIAGEARAGADAHALCRHRPLPARHGGSSAQEAPSPRAAWILRQSESGLSGRSVISMSKGLSASQIALQSVPGTSDGRPSPIPRLPSGV